MIGYAGSNTEDDGTTAYAACVNCVDVQYDGESGALIHIECQVTPDMMEALRRIDEHGGRVALDWQRRMARAMIDVTKSAAGVQP